MIDVNEFKENFDDRINYPNQGSYTIDQLNRWMRQASYGLFNHFLGFPEQAEFQTAVPKIAYARTRQIHFNLNPFRTFKEATVNNGVVLNAALPQDMAFPISAKYYVIVEKKDSSAIQKLKTCGCEIDNQQTDPVYVKMIGKIKYVEEDKWADRVNSSYLKTAIFCPYSDRWEFNFPIPQKKVRIEYLKIPATPIWNYTVAADGTEVYSPTGSTHLEWDALMIDKLVDRMQKLYSINQGDMPGLQISDTKIKNAE